MGFTKALPALTKQPLRQHGNDDQTKAEKRDHEREQESNPGTREISEMAEINVNAEGAKNEKDSSSSA
jgi:hypothetical protein